MFSNLNFWICIGIILFGFICFVQSSSESGKKIPYDVVLPPDGDGESLPPVIMLHGLLDWRKTWKKVAPVIAKNTGRKVYAYDAINHGENEWSDEFHFSTLASELEHFMDSQNISKAILVGHSMGGKTTMIFTTRKPERVEKLILEDISPRKPTTKIMNLMRMFYQATQLGLTEIQHVSDELAARKLMLRFLQRALTEKQINALGEDHLMEWMPITKRGEHIEPLANFDLLPIILNTKTPDDFDPGVDGQFHGDVLFLYGSKSPFDVSNDELIPKHFPHATLVKFEGGLHFLHFEFVEEVERVISDFINK